jgi:hypothetical protein
MIDLKKDQDTVFEEMEKLFAVISSISKPKRKAILDLIYLERDRLQNLWREKPKEYVDTIPKYLEYLDNLAYNIEHADEKYLLLKEENETLDTLAWYSPQKLFGNIRGRDREKGLAAMKLGIDI